MVTLSIGLQYAEERYQTTDDRLPRLPRIPAPSAPGIAHSVNSAQPNNLSLSQARKRGVLKYLTHELRRRLIQDVYLLIIMQYDIIDIDSSVGHLSFEAFVSYDEVDTWQSSTFTFIFTFTCYHIISYSYNTHIILIYGRCFVIL